MGRREEIARAIRDNAIFFDAAGRQILNLNIRVDQDVSSLIQTITRVLGNSSVHVEALNDKLLLTGEVSSAAEADRVYRLAQAAVAPAQGAAAGAAGPTVLNMLSIASPEQVIDRKSVV